MNLSIVSKVTFSMLAFLTVTFIVLVLFFNASNKSNILENEQKILSLHADRQIAYLKREFRQNKRDISLLSKFRYLSKLVESSSDKSVRGKNNSVKYRAELTKEFKRLIESREEYHQVRLIGVENNGREIIRVNRNVDGLEIVSLDKLQEKGNSPYFQETLKLPQGRYYISNIELNREHGVIAEPKTNVVRVSSPVYSRPGKLFGIIIINVDFTLPLHNLTNYLDVGEEFILVNPDKSIIHHDFNDPDLLNQSNTSINKNRRSQKKRGSMITPDFVVSKNRLELSNGRYFTFILRKPVSLITGNNNILIGDKEIVLVILLLSIFWGLVFIARYPLKKITNLSDIIRGITEGTHDRVELPVGQRSEIGDLSRAFNKLLDKIDDTQQDLKQGKEQLELAIKGASDGIWDWNIITNDLYLSPRLKEILGYRDDEISNDLNSYNSLIHPDDLNKIWSLANDYLEGTISKYERETRMAHKEGHYVDILIKAYVVRNKKGIPVRLVGTHTDITQRNKESEKRIQFEQEQKRVLIREVHHRIKNNLQGVASLLHQHAELNPSVREQLESAILQVFTMAMVHGLHGKGEHEGMSVSKMLIEILATSENITGTNISFKGDNDHCQNKVSEKESVPVALIINELVTNACKHSRTGEPVNVSTLCNWCLDGSMCIEISNKVDSFPEELSIEEKKGLGSGLKLVASLLPPEGVALDIREEDGVCITKLVLAKPVIYTKCDLSVIEVSQT